MTGLFICEMGTPLALIHLIITTALINLLVTIKKPVLVECHKQCLAHCTIIFKGEAIDMRGQAMSVSYRKQEAMCPSENSPYVYSKKVLDGW